MKILEHKEVPGLAGLYLAELPGTGMRMIEFVDTVEPGVDKKAKWVMMVSTQLGCAVGCRMCDAGAMGFHGNLTAEEMLAQIRRMIADNPELSASAHPKLKIHFARMGEPALNPAVLEALRRLSGDMPFKGIIPSLSTVAPKTPEADAFMEELIAVKDACYPAGRFQLQFSVHATSAALRGRIVPLPVWSPEEISAYGERFVRPGDRKVTLNFALAPGERLDLAEIRRVFSPERFLIKVTPVNPTGRAESNGSVNVWNEPPSWLAADSAALEAEGFTVILSPSAREEIAAETSCGQLWASAMKARAARREFRASARAKALPFSWSRAALLVVDMQEFFLDPASPAYMPQAFTAVENAAKLVRAFRSRKLPVLYTSHAHDDPAADGGLMALWWQKVCLSNTRQAQISPILGAQDTEVLRKCRYSAFSSTGLEERLRAIGVDSLVVAGLKTDLCVESTVRAAFDRDIVCVAACDAMAAGDAQKHRNSLSAMSAGFALVKDTDEIIAEVMARDIEYSRI